MLVHNCPSTGKGKKLEVPQGKEDKLKHSAEWRIISQTRASDQIKVNNNRKSRDN